SVIMRQPPSSPVFPYTTLFRSTLKLPPTSSCGLLTGSSAIVPFWFCRALSSSIACDPLDPFGLVGLGAVNGVQPSAGSKNPFSRSEEHTSELQSLVYLVCRLLI